MKYVMSGITEQHRVMSDATEQHRVMSDATEQHSVMSNSYCFCLDISTLWTESSIKLLDVSFSQKEAPMRCQGLLAQTQEAM